jgi:hypothetical protein
MGMSCSLSQASLPLVNRESGTHHQKLVDFGTSPDNYGWFSPPTEGCSSQASISDEGLMGLSSDLLCC